MPAPYGAPQVRGWLSGGALGAAGRAEVSGRCWPFGCRRRGSWGRVSGGEQPPGRVSGPGPPHEESEPPGGRNAAAVLPSRPSEKPPPYETREAGSFWALPERPVSAGLNFIFLIEE